MNETKSDSPATPPVRSATALASRGRRLSRLATGSGRCQKGREGGHVRLLTLTGLASALVLCAVFGCAGRNHLRAKPMLAKASADSIAIVYSSRYGVSIDTTVGQLRKWMWTESGGTEAYITVPFYLSFSDKLLILAEVDSVRFFDLPDAPPAPEEIDGIITHHSIEPSNYYSLKISVGHRVNTIHWQTESFGASEVFDRMQRMGHCIDRSIWSKDEYKRLPRGHIRI